MRHKYYGLFDKLLPIILFFLILSSEIFAQGKIIGHVKDKNTGEPLLGVNVIILNTYMGAATDIDGYFVIVNVPVGKYSLQATMVGANKVVVTDVVVSQNQTTKVDFELEQTAVKGQEVVITAKRDILHKEVSSSQTVIIPSQIQETAGINTLHEYLSQQAGITDSKYLDIRGGYARGTGTIINGMTFVNTRVGKSESFVPISGVEQVSLNSGGMTAEYGEFRSGIIDITTKTGSKEGYHGSFSFSRNQAQLKRFGRSLYDPMSSALRPHLDPDIAFIGVQNAVDQGIISKYDQQQFYINSNFRGFKFYTGNFLPSTWKASLINQGLDYNAISAVDMYLFDAWMHQVVPDFNKLNSVIDKLNAEGMDVGNKVTDEKLMNLFRNHANSEGRNYDFNFDGGFGGPIPFLSKQLGDMTFYLSNVTARTSYIEPVIRNYDLNSTTMLTLSSNITNHIKLKVTGLYNYHNGVSPTHGGDSEIPALYEGQGITGTGVPSGHERGAFLSEDDLPVYVESGWGGDYGPPMWWYQTMLQDWIQKNYMLSAKLTHALSASSFYSVNLSYQRTNDDINASDNRNNTVLYKLSGILPLTEMPYGRRILPELQTQETIDGFIFDEFYSVPGLDERFGSKGGVLTDNSVNQQIRAKIDFGSQINKANFVKTGAELLYMNLDNARWGWWRDVGSAYDYKFKVKPITIGGYIQDEITYEEMVLNIGLRADYYGEASGLKWPTGRPWDVAALGTPTSDPPNWLARLQSGQSIVWEQWDSLDNIYRAAGEQPLLEPVKSHFRLSPRIGISFPISERTKFYLNYGHFYALPPYSEMYMYNYRYGTAKGGLYNLGNPNLKPSLTIQYELGVDYNLLDAYLIHIAGYYKDIKDEVRTIRYVPKTGNTYSFRTNDAYRDIEGVEIQITKSVGEIFTGWMKGQYVYVSNGRSGRSNVYEDSASNSNPDLVNYYEDPSRPDPVPQVSANFTFKSPESWGYFLGGWRLSILPNWKQGQIFRYNPRGLDVDNEFRWPGYLLVDLGLSKTFDLNYVRATFTLDVRNLFNTKVFNYNYAFATGIGSANSPSADFKNYMESLHLSAYKDSYYDPIRKEKGVNGATEDAYLYPGYIRQDGSVVNENKVGDLRSTANPDINNPDIDVFMFGNPRSVWFGMKIDF